MAANQQPSTTVLPAVRQSRENFRRLVESACDIAMIMLDPGGRVAEWNLGAERIFGYRESEILGQPLEVFFTPEDRGMGIPQQLLKKALQTNQALDVRWHVRKDGSQFWADASLHPLFGDAGELLGFAKVLRDSSVRKQMEEKLSARARREEVLNKIAGSIRAFSDPERIESAATRALGESLAVDSSFVVRYEPASSQGMVGSEWYPPESHGWVSKSPVPGLQEQLQRALGTGSLVISNTRIVAELTELSGIWNDSEVYSLILVPLFTDWVLTAVVGVAMIGRSRAWTQDEQEVVEVVAAQTRTAVEAARVNQRAHNIAAQLQGALQPSLPKAVPGLSVRHYYRPGSDEAGVGGDFFDVFALPDQSTALIVGDVCGKGLKAAAQVATLRNMLRLTLYQGGPLSTGLEALNRILAENVLLTGFATLFVATFEPDVRALTYVSCGQPGLVRRSRSAIVEELSTRGAAFGMLADSRYESQRVILERGDAVALFTDGLTEVGPTRERMLGIGGVATLFSTPCPIDELDKPDEATDALVARLVADVSSLAGSHRRDDVCLLIALCL